ncbi:unnamed protein product [Phytomonas sp. Hart1]|nr:unnamed protein product [Phytomonas sp. Hart1]|eukprot:CCW67669.1 unnamed protein product [Phytomonas sp. isolate Hart1]
MQNQLTSSTDKTNDLPETTKALLQYLDTRTLHLEEERRQMLSVLERLKQDEVKLLEVLNKAESENPATEQ